MGLINLYSLWNYIPLFKPVFGKSNPKIMCKTSYIFREFYITLRVVMESREVVDTGHVIMKLRFITSFMILVESYLKFFI